MVAVLKTDLPGIKLFHRGKVRDVYELDDSLLIVATDRISAYDCIMPNGIPGKGKILTQMSLFWFDLVKDIVPNHLITAETDHFPDQLQPFAALLAGRSMLVRKAERFDVECVARGYLAGSGWREYCQNGHVCGIRLPEGLVESSQTGLSNQVVGGAGLRTNPGPSRVGIPPIRMTLGVEKMPW